MRDMNGWVRDKLRSESTQAWFQMGVWTVLSLIAFGFTYSLFLGLFARGMGEYLRNQPRGEGMWVLWVPLIPVLIICAAYIFVRRTSDDALAGPVGAGVVTSPAAPLQNVGWTPKPAFSTGRIFMVRGSAIWAFLFFLPMCMQLAWLEFRRVLEILALDAGDFAAAMELLVASDKRVPIEQLQAVMVGAKADRGLQVMASIRGIQYVPSPPAGLVLTAELRMECGQFLCG